MTAQYIKKRRDKCVLFLDDCFDADEAPARLLAAGFCQVELFLTHFPDSRDETKKQISVKDPSILRLCNSKGWLLITTDSDIRFTHVEEIKKCTTLAILATANNGGDDLECWIKGLCAGRARIEREFKKRPLPWYAQFNREGKITTIYTITEGHITRRNRPKEMEDSTTTPSAL